MAATLPGTAMEETKFSFLFNRYFDGLAGHQEEDEFLAMVKSETQQQELEGLMNQRWESFSANKNPFDNISRQRMLSAIYNAEKPHTLPASRLRIWPRVAIAAAIATILVSIGLWFYNGHLSPARNGVVYSKDIGPGTQGATLTLASGKKIRLTEAGQGELAKEAGVLITKATNGQLVYHVTDSDLETNKMNTLSTAMGETYQVVLPDGSVVWLNAASSLSYSVGLKREGKRRVQLEGEGYFEIAKDKAHPFVVESRGQQVEVLGTHFNINSYMDQPNVKTTLLEGSVLVNKQFVLKPGQQSVLHDGKMQLRTADVSSEVDWKNGDFVFKKESLDEIMKEIARWYAVEISYDTDVDLSQTFSGQVARSKNISQVLLSMASTGKLKFRIEGRRVFVS